jgi:hypothetical protein
MKFGIHNSSWLERIDPGEAFEAVKAKAQWAEHHSLVWFSVLDHMIQIPRVGAPDEPFLAPDMGLFDRVVIATDRVAMVGFSPATTPQRFLHLPDAGGRPLFSVRCPRPST